MTFQENMNFIYAQFCPLSKKKPVRKCGTKKKKSTIKGILFQVITSFSSNKTWTLDKIVELLLYILTFAQSPKDSRIGSMFSTASQEVTDLSSWLV